MDEPFNDMARDKAPLPVNKNYLSVSLLRLRRTPGRDGDDADMHCTRHAYGTEYHGTRLAHFHDHDSSRYCTES